MGRVWELALFDWGWDLRSGCGAQAAQRPREGEPGQPTNSTLMGTCCPADRGLAASRLTPGETCQRPVWIAGPQGSVEQTRQIEASESWFCLSPVVFTFLALPLSDALVPRGRPHSGTSLPWPPPCSRPASECFPPFLPQTHFPKTRPSLCPSL